MAGLKPRPKAFTLAIIFSGAWLAGCYSPSVTSPSDRALSVYREAKARRAAAMRDAGPEPADGRALTEDQAAELARKSSVELAEMQARAETAGARVDEAGQLKNPEVRISAVQLDEILQDKPKVDVGLRIFPARPGEIDARVAKARAGESAAQAEAKAAELAADAEARARFQSVLLFDAEIEAADEEASARAKLAEAVKARGEQGQATRVDEALAALSSQESSQETADLRAQREVALAALLDVVGLPSTAKVRLVGAPLDVASLPELPPEEPLIEAALAARPEIATAAARMDAASADAYLERSKQWPWLSFLQLGYDFEPGVRTGLGWSLGAGIDVPLFSVNSGGVRRADAESTEAQRAFEASVEHVAREVRERLRAAKAARDLARSFKESAVPTADQAAEAVKAALDAGQSDLLRVALVEERRGAVARRRLKLLRRYHEALAALRAVVGGRLPSASSSSPPEGSKKEPAK